MCDDVTVFRSTAHHGNVRMPEFEDWPWNKLQDVTFNDLVKRAADSCLDTENEVEFRDVTTHDVVWQLMRSCLPLPSNTQFVERGVKEAKNVSATGHKEEQRSACAIL